MYGSIEKFGANVLNYLISNSEDGDTILYAINDNIYNHLVEDRILFEDEIRSYVGQHGLDFQNNDNIALALAAHQIKLAYDTFEDNKATNEKLKNFYYSNNTNVNILWAHYYQSLLYQAGNNLQDRLWKKIKEILKSNKRKCFIPTSGPNEQKYINAQLVVLTPLREYFSKVFYYAGISKDPELTRIEFNAKIQLLPDQLSIILSQIISQLTAKNLIADGAVNFAYNADILIGQLWMLYKTWDGSLPDFTANNYNTEPNNIFYVNLFDADASNPNLFEFGEIVLTNMVGLTPATPYRVLSHHGGWVWKVEPPNASIPEFDSFAILTHATEKNKFSNTNMTEYTDIDNSQYVILKYSQKPTDFFKNLNVPNVVASTKKFFGGIKLGKNEYLDTGNTLSLPSSPNTKISSQISTDLFTDITLDNNLNYKLFKTNNQMPLSQNLISGWERIDANGLLAVNTQNNSNPVDDQLPFTFTSNVDLSIYNQGFIPENYLKISLDGNTFVVLSDPSLKQYQQSIVLFKNIGLGCYSQDPLMKNLMNQYGNSLHMQIEFKISQSILNKNYPFEISWFRVIITTKIPIQIKGHTFSLYRTTQSYKLNIISESTDNIQSSNTNLNDNFKDELFTYQDAIYKWLKYTGYATWNQISSKCRTLVETSKFKNDFSTFPEYKIFLTLLKIGIIDLFKIGGKYVFAVSRNIELISTKNNSYNYRNHFFGTQVLDADGLEFLQTVPSLDDYIQNSPSVFTRQVNPQVQQGFIKYSKNKYRGYLGTRQVISEPCVFKYYKQPFELEYFNDKDGKIFQLKKENPDVMNICKTYINKEKKKVDGNFRSFVYYPNQKKLLCKYLPDLPIMYLRALILNNPDILLKDDLYTSGCNGNYEVIFENVERNFVNELDKKLSN